MVDETKPNGTRSKNAYVTLLTRPSYLAGAILLAYTLNKHSPATPLIICYTPETLPASSVNAFAAEAKHSNLVLQPVNHLRLPDDGTCHGMVAERFIDTWTKLRVFDLWDMHQGWERLCWLDADMMIFSDPSPLVFNEANDKYLAGGDGMRTMAVHTCVCNLDRDAWAPPEWHQANCAMTPLSSPDQLAEVKPDPYTLSNFNSGTFLYRPSKSLADFVLAKFQEIGHAKLRAMKFPDQDFLNEAFGSRWSPLSWRTNALKTWRYWHPNIWTDDAHVAVVHYIVDKPWAARNQPDGSAGYLGKDGETHKWWWDEFARWQHERSKQGEDELVHIVQKHVANADGTHNQDLKAIGGGAQDFAKKWDTHDANDVAQDAAATGTGASTLTPLSQDAQHKAEAYAKGPHGPVLRKPMLGERGHGPVVRGGGMGKASSVSCKINQGYKSEA